jgi:putative ABC transport system permease protein
VLSGACITLGGSRATFYAGYVLFVAAAILATPVLSLALMRALRPVFRAVLPVEGTLAAHSLIAAPRRTSASVAAVMLSVALVVGFGGTSRASYRAIVDWMNAVYNADLFVLPSQDITRHTSRFPAGMEFELSGIEGIRDVQPVHNARITFERTPIMLSAVDLAKIAATSPRRVVAGNPVDMYRLAAAGQGVIVSDNLAQLHRLHLGQIVQIEAPQRVITVPVVGIVADYTEPQGMLLMDLSVFRRYWTDDTLTAFRVFLTPKASPDTVTERVRERYAGKRDVFVLSNREVKQYIVGITDQWFGLTWIQVAIAVFVALLGIANTTIVSVTDRRRELAVLRAVGGLRRQIRWTIWIEAVSIGALGLVLGLALGAINLYYVLEMVRRDMTGMRFDFAYPVAIALTIAPTIVAAAWVAAVWPAESAIRASLVAALEYE